MGIKAMETNLKSAIAFGAQATCEDIQAEMQKLQQSMSKLSPSPKWQGNRAKYSDRQTDPKDLHEVSKVTK